MVQRMTLPLALLVLSMGNARGASPALDGLEGRAAVAGNPRTALVLFVDSQDPMNPSISPKDLRTSSANILATVLERDGHQVLTYPEIEPLMRRSGMRSALDLPAEFLRELDSENWIAHLVITQLVIYADRVVLLARGLDIESRELHWADTAESSIAPDFWSDPERAIRNWNELMTGLGKSLGAQWSEEPSGMAGPTLVLLPAEPIGLAEQSAALTTQALLGALLESRRYRIPDPALVRNALTSRGYDPRLLDAAGRAELMDLFAPSVLLAPEVVSFEAGSRTGAAPIGEPESDGAPPPIAASRSPLYLQVLVVAGDTGLVTAAESAYLKPDDPLGLFGLVRRVPLARRFENAARQIVQRLQVRGGSI